MIAQGTEGEKVRPDLQRVTPDILASSRKLLRLKYPLGSGPKGIIGGKPSQLAELQTIYLRVHFDQNKRWELTNGENIS